LQVGFKGRRETGAAGDVELTAADIAAIDRAFPRGPKPRNKPNRASDPSM
jgi:hypothetical protein